MEKSTVDNITQEEENQVRGVKDEEAIHGFKWSSLAWFENF